MTELYEFILLRMPRNLTLWNAIKDAWGSFRRNKVDEDMHKKQLIVDVFNRDGARCFYAGRGLGDCSEDVQLDRIKPETRGGKYTIGNCVLACGCHNKMRGDKDLEDFLNP